MQNAYDVLKSLGAYEYSCACHKNLPALSTKVSNIAKLIGVVPEYTNKKEVRIDQGWPYCEDFKISLTKEQLKEYNQYTLKKLTEAKLFSFQGTYLSEKAKKWVASIRKPEGDLIHGSDKIGWIDGIYHINTESVVLYEFPTVEELLGLYVLYGDKVVMTRGKHL